MIGLTSNRPLDKHAELTALRVAAICRHLQPPSAVSGRSRGKSSQQEAGGTVSEEQAHKVVNADPLAQVVCAQRALLGP